MFLAGLTGVGKSRFVEHELCKPGQKPFLGENSENIERWAKARSPVNDLVLFLDEANLSQQQWSQFEGLFQQPPGILIAGVYYPLTEKHKVVFAGNPLSYGDERDIAPLFRRHGNTLVFKPLPLAFIYEKTIKPVLTDQLDKATLDAVSHAFLDVYQFLVECSKKDVLISPRQVQMMALLVRDFCQQNPNARLAEIQTMAKFHAQSIAAQLVPTAHQDTFNQRFPALQRPAQMTIKEQPLSAGKHLHPPSRQTVRLQIQEFLRLREAARDLQNENNAAICYGGLNRLVLEGIPGIGKSEMIVELLLSQGLTKGNPKIDYLADEESNIFYHMPASMAYEDKEKLFLKAFNEGAIVLIDEINCVAMMEKLLNSLLDGVHPESPLKKPKPGFRIIGTQNPATMAGRGIESPALANRTLTLNIEPYAREEMVNILIHMGLDARRSQLLVKAFETKAAEATLKHYEPAPSFRNLITAANWYIKGSTRAISVPKDAIKLLEQAQVNDQSMLKTTALTQLTAFGTIGNQLSHEIMLLEKGVHSTWSIWQDSQKKLSAILNALEGLPHDINEEQLLDEANEPNRALYLALHAFSACTGDAKKIEEIEQLHATTIHSNSIK